MIMIISTMINITVNNKLTGFFPYSFPTFICDSSTQHYTSFINAYTVLNQSFRRSQVTGLPKSSEMSQGHRSQGQVLNLSSKSKNPKKWVLKVARCFFYQFLDPCNMYSTSKYLQRIGFMSKVK